MEHGVQHPDFPLAVRSLETLTEQVARCQHLPAVDGGVRLMQRMEVILERLAALEQAMNRRFNGVDQRLDGLHRRVVVA